MQRGNTNCSLHVSKGTKLPLVNFLSNLKLKRNFSLLSFENWQNVVSLQYQATKSCIFFKKYYNMLETSNFAYVLLVPVR